MPHFRFVSTMGGAPWGGSEELWTGAALRLLERGHEVTVHVYGWPEDPPRIAALASRGARVERRPQKARFWRRAWMKAIGWPLGRETFRRADRRATDLVVIS